jgi:chorismate dehydratase
MKYRIAAVSYVNTLPFLYGLGLPDIRDRVDVVLAHPARCADLLQRGEVDIALCPVGALPGLGKYHVISDYCIGCDGPVRTVSIYSHKPLEELTHIVLYAESRTSNLLVQMINNEYWHHKFTFSSTSSTSSASSISSGFLFIGDICFQKEQEFAFRTDLGQAWKEWTGLPFAFACWVSKREIDHEVIQAMNATFAEGINSVDQLTFPAHLRGDVLREYLKTNISYAYDHKKKEALVKFLAYPHHM